ncbi:hypothetical protein AOC36_09070 [Erysipelothrix larvae]|uniref:DUF2179 domain-containing protein n=1 Tax=Erysipelothrix larvae TaxID=1514105 RepID=A0A0X8H135_9FIRM|nr:YitT family protein [Erysipelothrix larvae]AMC94133.1 hypothetical protein AOC36_09070 [Erysipelothrix larvae]
MNHKTLIRILWIALGVGLITLSIQWFLAPFNIAAGGASGLGIILHSMIDIEVGTVVLLFNIVVLTLAYFMLERKVFANALIGSIMLPIFLDLVPELQLVNDQLFAVIVGSIGFGIGVFVLFSHSASSGGTTIPPLILKKKFNIDPALSLMITDAFVVGFSFFIFGVESFLLAIFSILLTMATMNFLKSQSNNGRSIMIMSPKHEEIRTYITKTLSRGVTILSGQGGYTQESFPVLIVAVKGKEYKTLIHEIQKIDPDAFMISQNTHNIYGSGFTYTRAV